MRVSITPRKKLTKRDLAQCLFPTENMWFWVALSGGVIFLILLFSLIYVSADAALIFIGVLLLTFWLLYAMARANLIANSVKVSKKNFPNVQKVVDEVKFQLNYEKDIEVFVVEEGSVNAFFAFFFRTRYIILNSELLVDMLNPEKKSQLKWVIARFIGAVKVKHLRLEPIMYLIEGVESLKLLNILILPYKRSTQYSGDNIGLLVCGSLSNAMQAFDKFLVGNNLSKHVNLAGMIDQRKDSYNNFFVALTRWFSSYPHITDRYLNLLAFARYKFPDQFHEYISSLDNDALRNLAGILPDYYNEMIKRKETRRIDLTLNPTDDVRRRIRVSKR